MNTETLERQYRIGPRGRAEEPASRKDRSDLALLHYLGLLDGDIPENVSSRHAAELICKAVNSQKATELINGTASEQGQAVVAVA